MTADKKKIGLDLLREPFPANQISKLPKPYKKDSPKGQCKECGGYHGLPAMHLDYVGHAALTNRLLDVDPIWSWEPLSMDERGLPYIDKDGGLWIKLTVLGVTRLGYGDAEGKAGGNAMKERIGDALRNAAMRFGAALDLWHKGDLHIDDNDDNDKPELIDEFQIDDVKLAMRESESIEDLKSIFGAAYKKANESQKAELKAAYDKNKAGLTNKGIA